jgi:hypothetical protein
MFPAQSSSKVMFGMSGVQASQIHLVKLDSCFQDLSMLCAKYQSSGIAGSQEEDF